jgi:hypothetical protein
MNLGQSTFLLISIILGCAVASALPGRASANAGPGKETSSPESLSFTAQCPEFLKEADDFAKDCLIHAREQVRYFHPELNGGGFSDEGIKEVHRAYFKAARPGSHFSLGCTINGDGKNIRFLGVYYATKDSNFKAANSAPLRYITFDGDVGIWVDGNPVNLSGFRQFDTASHPLTDWRKNRIKNCENATLPDGGTRVFNGRFRVTESHEQGKLMLDSCQYDGKGGYDVCQPNEYVDLFATKDHQIIDSVFHGGGNFLYITSGGDLLAKKDVLSISCQPTHRKLDNPNILQEVCDPPAK